MTRTQVQLPEALYQRAKSFAAERELLLDRYPAERKPGSRWKLPKVDGGGLRVPLAQLRTVLADEEAARGLRRK